MFRRNGSELSLRGMLYEIKLICLMYFRAFHDDDFKEFQIASNTDEVGYFDDICFTAKVKGLHKPVAVFIRVRHRGSEKSISMSDFTKDFHRYIGIRQGFYQSNKNPFLNSAFDDSECFYVIYTNTSLVPTYEVHCRSDFSAKLNDLIGTDGLVSQPAIEREYVKSLCEVAMKEQIIYLAQRMANFIYNDRQILLNDEIVQRFHVILAREVFDVSEIQPDGHRIASFRLDFFDSHSEYLSIFKETLFIEIINKTKVQPTNLEHLISEFLSEPTDPLKLSKLIQIGVKYRNGNLQLEKYIRGITEKYGSDIKRIEVSQTIVQEAVQLATREKLSNLQFKVPAAFGNKDLTMSSRHAERRMNYLVANIVELLKKNDPTIGIAIDDSLNDGFLRLNGGIAGAIGNIFVLDDNTKLMKITNNWEQLGTLSKSLYLKLNNEIPNLQDYKFCFNFKNCPKLSFDCSQYEEDLVIGFLNRLLIYSGQADDDGIEEILKMEIENYPSDHANNFVAATDAIFSRYFCLLQKWWLQPRHAPYLTREYNLFYEATHNILKDPLMSSINIMCKSKIKQYNYTFNEDAVSFLTLRDHNHTVIITDNSQVTVVKMMQQLRNTANVVLHFDLIAALPTKDCYDLCSEIKNTNKGKVLIFVCDVIKQDNLFYDYLERIAKAAEYKRSVIVTNQETFKVLQGYFPKANKIYQDRKLRMIDLHEESQTSMFENATAIFPGVEIPLDELLRGWVKPGAK
ncbi:hypothetical protein PYW08_012898 [Mythimna loreyi]|uniref:Uncharacterized protein n=1 Tax=Mythimna loreyi TaxID=667449 RepID=A0ACC2Q486_9NEOP|nr:hypothetical protein PYW08_012898 [Mythimna loreyi]